MMVQKFLSDFLNVLVWIACLAVGGVFVGVGVRCFGGLLMASLLETKRKCGVWVVSPLLAMALVCTVIAQKDGGANTNTPPDGVSGTNVVTQVEGGTNDWTNIQGTNTVGQTNGGGTDGAGSVSGPLMLGARMGALPSGLSQQNPPPVEAFAVRPANAVENARWRARGAHVDGMTIPASGWSFRTPAGFLESLLVYSYGEIQPDVETTYFPRPFPDADFSLLPEGRWGMMPHEGAESLFWHATSPSNSLILTWQNAAYNRDANCPTNLQIELFSNGTYVYRYDDRTEHHAVEYPFDLDGDGLENSVDPDPLTPGNDAHGTNAEWYDLVCSDVFSKTEQPSGLPIPLPGGESVFFKPGVNTNAYYFVDVVAERGPAPIHFNSSHPGRLGSPVVVALGGETNRVPLLIGATYSVSSDVPFAVSCPTNGFAEVSWNDGTNAMVKWPLNFTFTEELSGTSRSYTVGVEPFDPGGTFEWRVENGELRMGAGEDGILHSPFSILHLNGGACGCVSGNGTTVTFGCSPTCTCDGNCLAVGVFNMEHALFAVTGGVCRCGFDDPPPATQPTHEPTDGASLEIAFSGPTVAFEGESGRASDALRVKKSTRVSLTVSAYGGPNGGTATFSRTNFAKLRLVGVNGFELPSSLHLDAGQSFFATCVCEGVEASSAVNDIVVSGRLVEDGAGTPISASASLTSCRVAFVTPSGDPAIREEETDSGDGQNEFTFDDATQTLTIGLKVCIEPDVTQLSSMGQCVFSLPPISGSVLTWTGNSGRIGLPMPQSGGAGALVQATARYVGYPLSNSGFGRKTATFNALGLTITTDFEVFFPSDGTHHPACSTCANCPNWFYYWREGGVCIPNEIVFENLGAGVSGRFNQRTKVICVGPEAVLEDAEILVPGKERKVTDMPQLNPEDTPVAVTNWVPVASNFWIGASGAGIRSVAATVKHEMRHKEIFLSHPENELNVRGPNGDIIVHFDDENPDDEDWDGVWNVDEASGRWEIMSDENDPDTYGLGRIFENGDYGSIGDDEIRARLSERQNLESAYHAENDWCNPGCQSKVRRGPMKDESRGDSSP